MTRDFSCDGDDENQAPSTEIYEDNCRLNRTINYPGQDRAIMIFYSFLLRSPRRNVLTVFAGYAEPNDGADGSSHRHSAGFH